MTLDRGLPAEVRHLYSFDQNEPATRDEIAAAIEGKARLRWEFHRLDTRHVSIPLVDMLFVDTLHTYDQVMLELRDEVLDQVAGYIAFHDTTLFGHQDEGRGHRLSSP